MKLQITDDLAFELWIGDLEEQLDSFERVYRKRSVRKQAWLHTLRQSPAIVWEFINIFEPLTHEEVELVIKKLSKNGKQRIPIHKVFCAIWKGPIDKRLYLSWYDIIFRLQAMWIVLKLHKEFDWYMKKSAAIYDAIQSVKNRFN